MSTAQETPDIVTLSTLWMHQGTPCQWLRSVRRWSSAWTRDAESPVFRVTRSALRVARGISVTWPYPGMTQMPFLQQRPHWVTHRDILRTAPPTCYASYLLYGCYWHKLDQYHGRVDRTYLYELCKLYILYIIIFIHFYMPVQLFLVFSHYIIYFRVFGTV